MRPSITRGSSHATLAILMAIALPAATGHAYCVLPASERWSPPPGPIPVYVSTDLLAGTGLQLTDVGDGLPLSPDAEIRWVKAAIDLINASSADTPRLYYAGTDVTVGYALAGNFWSTRNEGITISTYGPCNVEPNGAGGGFTHSGNKGAIRVIRGGDMSCGPSQSPPNEPHLWWADPRDDALPGYKARYDFVGVLVHELGHALGLEHTEGGLPCDNALANPQFPAFNMNSVMYWTSKDFRRGLRRDDLEGLRALYGAPERNVYWSRSMTAVPTQWFAPQMVSRGLRANTPVVIANAARHENNYALVGLTNEEDEVRYLTGNWAGWDANANFGLSVPGANGQTVRSFDRVGVARGRPVGSTEDRRLIAWVGGPSEDCCDPEPGDSTGTDVRIHYQVQADGVWFPPHATAPTRTKNLGVGYDPREDLFVMAYIDTCDVDLRNNSCTRTPDRPWNQYLFVRTIKAWLGGGGCTQALTTAGPVHDVGDVACNVDSSGATRCTIPVATTESEGPFVRYIEGTIEPHDDSICFVRQVDPPTTLTGTLALGRQGAAIDSYHPLGVLVGTHSPGFSGTLPGPSGYSSVYTMTRGISGWLSGVSDNETSLFATEYWPMFIGNMNKTTPTEHHQWRLVFAR